MKKLTYNLGDILELNSEKFVIIFLDKKGRYAWVIPIKYRLYVAMYMTSTIETPFDIYYAFKCSDYDEEPNFLHSQVLLSNKTLKRARIAKKGAEIKYRGLSNR